MDDANAVTLVESSPPAAADIGAVRPSRVRFGVLAFLCTMGALLYIDRACIGQAASEIRKDLNLTNTQMGLVFTVFSLAYCIFEVPAGHWGDRHGSRGVIARVVIWWSIFTALTGAAMGFGSLLLIRFLFGAGEAGAYPNAARVVTKWFPSHERGRARGAITFLSLVGAAIAPLLSGYLIKHVGWRMMFVLLGCLGVFWAIAFYRWFRDEPAKHPRTNARERALLATPSPIDNASETADGKSESGVPWLTVFASPNVWLLGTIMMVSGSLFYMLFQWYPTYLKEARGQTEMSSARLTSIVMCGGALGCLAGGFGSDLILRLPITPKWARRIMGIISLGGAGAFALAVRSVDSPGAVTLCNAAALFFMQAGMPTWWAVVAETSGRHGGAMWGLLNSMASLALMGVTLTVGWLVDHRQAGGYTPTQSWSPVFDGVAAGLLIGAVCWLFVDSTQSMVEKTEPSTT